MTWTPPSQDRPASAPRVGWAPHPDSEPEPEEESSPTSSLPLLVDLLGWTGGVLVALALLSLIAARWEDLPTWGRPLLSGIVTVLTAAGAWLVGTGDVDSRRLAIACGGLAGVTGVLTVGLGVDAAFAGGLAAPVLASSVAAFTAAVVVRDRVSPSAVVVLETVMLAAAVAAAGATAVLSGGDDGMALWAGLGVCWSFLVACSVDRSALRRPAAAGVVAACSAALAAFALSGLAGLPGAVALTATGGWAATLGLRRGRPVTATVGGLALAAGVPLILRDAGIRIDVWSGTLLTGSAMVLTAGIIAWRGRRP